MRPVASVDVVAAREVCKAVGTRIVEVHPLDRFTAEYRRSLRSNLCCDEGEWMFGLIDHIVGRYRTIWDGAAGDTLSAPRLQPPANLELFRVGRLEELAERMLGRDAGPMVGAMPPEFRSAAPRDAARALVAAEFAKLSGAPNPLAMFNLYNRGRREIGIMSTAMFAGVPYAYLPFLDHELFDFLAGLPHEIRHRGDFHDVAIARSYPVWADLPYAPRGRTCSAAASYVSFGMRGLRFAASVDPSWFLRLPRVVAQWGRFGLRASARRTQRWLSPGRMLHVMLLEILRDDPARLLRDLEREPGVAEQGSPLGAAPAGFDR
jgi:hypothetical protein